MRVALVGAELEENLAVRYLAGSLEAEGHEVELLVFDREEELERQAARLARGGAPLAGMSLVFTRRAAEFARLATRARELGYRGHLTVGGHFAAFHAEALLADVPAIDSVVIGEGEAILCDLAAHLDRLEAVDGLVYRGADGAIRRNRPASKAPRLDALPWPLRKRPYDGYLGLPIVNMLGSRGCAHACAFCSIAAWHRLCGGARLRLREPEAIAEEMGALYEDGVRVFNFHDDNFILPNRRLMLDRLDRLERALAARGVGRIAFAIKARPDEVDRELFERLIELGLFRVFLGVEAGSADALQALGRGQALEDNERALALVNELGLHACFNLLLFHPDSTLEDVRVNVEFLRAHPHNPRNFCRTEVYSGTPLERSLRAEGRLLGTYWGYDYRIADPRAQRAFEIAFAAFEERNFGDGSLHHWAMRVDYEYHLLARFFGASPALRERVGATVRAINLDTSGHLARIVEGVAAGEDPRRLREEVVRAVARSDARLGREVRGLLAALHAAWRGAPPPSSDWRQRAAAAGLAAALAVGGVSCGDEPGGTHPTEMVPVPGGPGPKVDVTHPTEMVPAPSVPPMQPLQPGAPPPAPPAPLPLPPPPPEEPDDLPLGDPAAIRPQLLERAGETIARYVTPARPTLVELTLDAGGRVTEASVVARGLSGRARAALEARLRRLTFDGDELADRRFEVALSARDLDPDLGPPPRPTERTPGPFISEMAPRPSRKVAKDEPEG